MSYALDFSVVLGLASTGYTLEAQLVNSSGAPSGAAIGSGFTEIGSGNYLWNGTIPDAFRGGVIFKRVGITEVLAFVEINPQTSEGQVNLGSSALDNIIVESGLNARQALSLIVAALAGTLRLATDTNVQINSVGGNDLRINATVNASGERLAVNVYPPT